MKHVEGDLIELAIKGQFDVIVHGCNCYHTMGAGIAKAIKLTFPEAYEADKQTTKGDKSKLGTISFAEVSLDGRRLVIVNAYTQHEFGRGKRHANEEAIEQAFRAVKARFGDLRIGYPRVGAGLAKGDWSKISHRIDKALEGADHTVVDLPKDQYPAGKWWCSRVLVLWRLW
jgi:O-acetyl-ADP-ribose deacetylase (regulator of RNase III)